MIALAALLIALSLLAPQITVGIAYFVWIRRSRRKASTRLLSWRAVPTHVSLAIAILSTMPVSLTVSFILMLLLMSGWSLPIRLLIEVGTMLSLFLAVPVVAILGPVILTVVQPKVMGRRRWNPRLLYVIGLVNMLADGAWLRWGAGITTSLLRHH